MSDPRELRSRIEEHVRRHELIEPGGDILCLVSGGADSTCLWHALGALGYRVTALHVNHGLRARESDDDARHCRELLAAEVVDAPPARTEAELRELRYALSAGRGLRATGHTASDQVETILYRIATSGRPGTIKARREDGVVRPLLPLWRAQTEAYCAAEGLAFRTDSSNDDTVRGLIRRELLPVLRRLHPAAEENVLALAEEPARLPRGLERTLTALLATDAGTKEADLGAGLRAVREYGEVSLERGSVRFGPWTIEADDPTLRVRTRRPGDRLAGRRKKLQDVLVDAKVPRRERDRLPVVVRGDEVVAVPGILEADGVRAWTDDG